MAVLDNVLGGGHFGFVKKGELLMESSSANDERERISVAVKTLKGTLTVIYLLAKYVSEDTLSKFFIP